MKRNKEFFQTITNDFLSPGTSAANTKPKTSIEQQTFTFDLNNISNSNSIEHADLAVMVDRLSMPSSPSSSSSSSSPIQNYSKLTKPKLTHCLANSPQLHSPHSPTLACYKKSNNNNSLSDWKWKSEDGIRKKKSRKESWVQMASRAVILDENKSTLCFVDEAKKIEQKLVRVANQCNNFNSAISTANMSTINNFNHDMDSNMIEINNYIHNGDENVNGVNNSHEINNNSIDGITNSFTNNFTNIFTNNMVIEDTPTITIVKPPRIIRTSIKISELLN